MADAPRVYLAGKIEPNDWRGAILGEHHRAASLDLDPAADTIDCWPEAPFKVDGVPFTYVGPWFVSCDHCCYHGRSKHGTLDGCMGEPLSPGNPHDYYGDEARWLVPQLAITALRKADIIFAWLDGPEAYGTIFELGYAIGSGKRVHLYSPPIPESDCPIQPVSDWWFAENCCGIKRAITPLDGFRQVASVVGVQMKQKRARRAAVKLCESPIERLMLEQLLEFFPVWIDDHWEGNREPYQSLSLRQQRQVGQYRLDFAIHGMVTKVAVECDGHDYHERTKEQAQHDKSRDRWLVENGWQVLRFTGREVHQHAEACARQAVSIAVKLERERTATLPDRKDKAAE